MSIAVALVLAYLIGSLNMSIIIAKLLGKPDPRTLGSGNAGATNVLRTGSKKDAAWVLIGDILKGVVAVIIGRICHLEGFWLALTAFVAVFGHIFPLYFGFKGGKGVATMAGVLFALNIWIGVTSMAVWVIVALLSRFASLASLCAALMSIAGTFIFHDYHYLFPLIAITVLIFWKHRANIQRLISGKESKINL